MKRVVVMSLLAIKLIASRGHNTYSAEDIFHVYISVIMIINCLKTDIFFSLLNR